MGIDNIVDWSFGRKWILRTRREFLFVIRRRRHSRNPILLAAAAVERTNRREGEEEKRTARVLSRARTRARACCRGGGDRPRQPFYK